MGSAETILMMVSFNFRQKLSTQVPMRGSRFPSILANVSGSGLSLVMSWTRPSMRAVRCSSHQVSML